MSAWTIARVRGIPVRVHWSLLLVLPLFAYVMAQAYFVEDGLDVRAVLWGGALALTLFGSVLLHEFSHSLMALRFGAQVRSILLMPLGGISQMESMPEHPRQEFLVTLVGPLTNFVLAAPLLAVHFTGLVPDRLPGLASFVRWSGLLNVGLGAFNLLLPAFPMDGGRLLRAGLATRMGRRRATHVAAMVGRAVAVALGLVGFLAWGVGGIWLVLIAFFIFMGAGAEERGTVVQALLSDLRVRDVMTADVETLLPDDTLADALERMLKTRHTGFPVLEDGRVVGHLGLEELAGHDRARYGHVPVRQAMRTDVVSVSADQGASELLQRMQGGGRHHILVLDGDRLVGIVSATDVERIVQVLDVAELRAR